MNLIDSLFNPTFHLTIGNLILLVSSFPMIMTAYKDRDVLRGYNFWGSIGTLLGITFFQFFYLLQFSELWVSLFLNLPNYAYWGIVVISLVRYRNDKSRVPEQ